MRSVQHHLATCVAKPHQRTSAMPSRSHRRGASARSAGVRDGATDAISVKLVFRKLRAGEVTSRNGCSGGRRIDAGHVIRQPRHARVVRRPAPPSRGRNETACPAAGTREEMRPLERHGIHRSNARAAPSAHQASRRLATSRRSSSIAVISNPRCFAPSRAASPCSTSWLERHSPGGSISLGPIWMWLWPPA